MPKKDFNVVIMHGTANDYKAVKAHILRLGYNPIVIKETITNKFLLDNVRDVVWKRAHCAVVIMSPDDMTDKQQFRARQNVVFELGYCLGAFDSIDEEYWYEAVIIMKEASVETFSDIHGVQFLEYKDRIKRTDLSLLANTLKETFKKAAEYYEEL